MSRRNKKPTYWELKRKISLLERLILECSEPDKILPLLKFCFNGIDIKCQTIKNEYLYRSRWNEKGRIFQNISEVSYKPAYLVNRKGRLNYIGESIIYVAACELGTIIESRPDINKLFTIIKIKCLNPQLLYFPIGMPEERQYYTHLKGVKRQFIELCNREITKLINHEDEYNSTIAIGRQFLNTKLVGYGRDEYMCVAYPSVESSKISNKTTFNIAIKPDVFDKNFQITEATVYCLTNEVNHYQLNDLNKTERIENGCLVWKYSFEEMNERISRGMLYDGNICENIIEIVKSE